ncbi:Metallo-dependent phosphatase [Obba rivulosa]|uniref:Metallo-dependent phosphatase n=1 Tax=Obba rivulosa TaxID=1052685 RepID=A0A8E2DQ88_9APHY|nr:Metallo-dependent phosphatase [Obba rivulosa]
MSLLESLKSRPSWTRFVCVSDTHSRIFPVPPGDVLLHAGDLSSWGTLAQLQVTLDWIQTLPHPVKILIAGNHDDVDAAQAVFYSQQLRDAGIYYLEHESVQIVTDNGRKWEIYGSPSAPRYAIGAFQYETKEEGNEIYKEIPPSTEILLTHTPPHGICDVTRKGVPAGCKALAKRMQSKDLRQCRLHVFGHIHEAHGAVLTGIDGRDDRTSVNAAMHAGEQAIIVDLKN